MRKTTKQPRKDTNQLAKSIVDSSLERLNKAADNYQARKEVIKNLAVKKKKSD